MNGKTALAIVAIIAIGAAIVYGLVNWNARNTAVTDGWKRRAVGGKHAAVVVGCTNYLSATRLPGCVEEANKFASYLIGRPDWRPEDVRFMPDPSGDEIKQALAWLVSQKAQTCVFYYSGHGTYQTDDELHVEEHDARDEMLWAIEKQGAASAVVLDDDLNDILVQKLQAGTKLVCFIDSCHSGSMLDLKYSWRVDPSDPAGSSPEPSFSSVMNNDYGNEAATVICVGASYDTQTSKIVNGISVFTSLLMAVLENQPDVSAAELAAQIHDHSDVWDQYPVVSCNLAAMPSGSLLA